MGEKGDDRLPSSSDERLTLLHSLPLSLPHPATYMFYLDLSLRVPRSPLLFSFCSSLLLSLFSACSSPSALFILAFAKFSRKENRSTGMEKGEAVSSFDRELRAARGRSENLFSISATPTGSRSIRVMYRVISK